MATMMLEAPPSASEEPQKRWTRTEYRRLIAEGILQDGKVELVNGEIWDKMGQGRRHILVVTWILKALSQIFDLDRIQTQSSLPVSEYGDPEPDAALLKQTLDHYLDEDPPPAEMLLVVEASDSTLRADLTAKVRQYGSAGIPEYWVVDIPNRLLHVFRDPIATGYATETILTTEDEVSPLSAPESAVRVADLLP
jgi:Uma2 family endonuclease